MISCGVGVDVGVAVGIEVGVDVIVGVGVGVSALTVGVAGAGVITGDDAHPTNSRTRIIDKKRGNICNRMGHSSCVRERENLLYM